MGTEALCHVRIGRKRHEGTAHLEGEEILFRGDVRLKILFASIQSVVAKDGLLVVTHADGKASFELGEQSAKWLDKIQNPKTLLDKLGVKPGQRVTVLGVGDEEFLRRLDEKHPVLSDVPCDEELDFIFLAIEAKEQLRLIEGLDAYLGKKGALWIVYPKGVAYVTSADIMAAGKAAGLVDVKVVKFSQTHTGLKFVIPKARR